MLPASRQAGRAGASRHNSFLPHPGCLTGDPQGPALAASVLRQLGQRVGEVGGEGAVDLRLQLAQVDLDDLVVLRALVRPQVLAAQVRQGEGGVCG